MCIRDSLACVPMNDDAHAILADMGDGEDLKGAKLDVAVNAIVGSLVRNGYLAVSYTHLDVYKRQW